MKRREQKMENTWDLTKIYKDSELINGDLEKVELLVEKLVDAKGSLFASIDKFENTLDSLFEYELLISKAYTYAHHKLDEDLSNQDSQKIYNIVMNKYVLSSQKLAFIVPEIMDSKNNILGYLKDDKYKEMRKYFSDIFRFDKYTLSEKEERIMSLASDVMGLPYKAYNSLVDSEFVYEDIKVDGEVYELTQGMFSNYLTSQNRDLRKGAFENLYEPFKKHIDTLAILYNGQINSAKFSTRSRGYGSNIESALYSTNIDVEVYQNLVSSVNDNININHKYVDLRKEKLGYDKIHLYDMYVPLIADFDKEITFEESKDIILDVFKVFGDDYVSVLEEAFNDRWIDVYENESKRSGAYSGGMYLSPPYILLNYTDKINDLYTLAHELGHSMHTYLTNKNQKNFNSHYKIFIAEVASIVNELLLTNYLLKKSDNKDEKAYLLNYLLEQFRTTLIRQTMFCEFEMLSHDKVEKTQDLTSDELNEMYYELNEKYFGKSVEIDEKIKYEWARIPHFYYNFYVYQYATSFCAAIKISNAIMEDNTYVNKYLEFLSLGDSVYPLDALKSLGIDLSQKEVIDEAMETYENILKEFRRLI